MKNIVLAGIIMSLLLGQNVLAQSFNQVDADYISTIDNLTSPSANNHDGELDLFSEADWLDECNGYQYIGVTEYSLRESDSITLGGIKYYSGLSFYLWNGAGTSQALFNLHGKYDSLTFKAGRIDGTTNADAYFIVYLDGYVSQTINLNAADLPKDITVPLNGAQQMKIELHTDAALNVYNITYGVVDGKWVQKSDYTPKTRQESTWLDDCSPYQLTSSEIISVNDKIYMGGDEYNNALKFYLWNGAGTSQALFNLHGKYESVTFKAGKIDKTTNSNAYFVIYLDGIATQTIELNATDLPQDITVALNGAQQMKIGFYTNSALNVYDITYGIGEGKFKEYNDYTPPRQVSSTWLKHCEPYQLNSAEIFKGNDKIYMGGDEYANAIRFYKWNYYTDSKAYFNLNSKYKTLTFKIGHVDNTTRSKANFLVYMDGEVKQEIYLYPDDLPKEITLSVENVNQLIFQFDLDEASNVYYNYYAIGAAYFDQEPIFVFGDVSGDGKVTAKDAAMVLQKTLVNTYTMPIQDETDDWLKYADVSADGIIAADDAAIIRLKSMRDTYQMPCETKYK